MAFMINIAILLSDKNIQDVFPGFRSVNTLILFALFHMLTEALLHAFLRCIQYKEVETYKLFVELCAWNFSENLISNGMCQWTFSSVKNSTILQKDICGKFSMKMLCKTLLEKLVLL